MLQIFLLIFCCLACVRADDTEERLKTLERIVQIQSESISSLKHDNSQLKARVRHLEKDRMRLKDIVERERGEDFSSILYTNDFSATNETDKSVDATIRKKSMKEQIGLGNLNTNIVKKAKRGRISKRLLGQAGDVAFYVFLSANRCFNDHQVIDYDGKELDMGNGYDKNDGIYVVPVSGVYVFTWTFTADYSQYAVTEIAVNGVPKGWTLSDGSNSSAFLSPSTSQIIVHVSAGDHVYIRRVEGRGCTAVSNKNVRSAFSGFRLFP